MTRLACDLLVVGGGPAGSAAAVSALRAAPKLSVLVIEAARHPREKACGGAITGGGLRELELAGLELRVQHAVASHAVLRVSGVSRRVELPHPAVVVRRTELDADLAAQARSAGARVEEGTPFVKLVSERGGGQGEGGVAVVRRADGGDPAAPAGEEWIRYRVLIAADGVSGACRRALGLPPGLRVPVREGQAPSAGQWDLVFDLDAGFPGYAWRFPSLAGGRAGESFGVFSARSGPGLEDTLAHFAEREGLPAGEAGRSAIRIFDPTGPVGEGTALLAGEALGVDGLAGEGIRYALWSGRIAGELAARALLRGRPPSLVEYRARLLASRSGAVLALASKLAPRLYGADPTWRALAADRRVAEALASLVSGAPLPGPLFALARRLPVLRRLGW